MYRGMSVLTGETDEPFYRQGVSGQFDMPHLSLPTLSSGLSSASGVLGDTTVSTERSVGDSEVETPSWKFLKPDGT